MLRDILVQIEHRFCDAKCFGENIGHSLTSKNRMGNM